jgi:hypothetical protein
MQTDGAQQEHHSAGPPPCAVLFPVTLQGNDTLYHCTVKRPAIHPRLVALSPGIPLGQMLRSEADLKVCFGFCFFGLVPVCCKLLLSCANSALRGCQACWDAHSKS